MDRWGPSTAISASSRAPSVSEPRQSNCSRAIRQFLRGDDRLDNALNGQGNQRPNQILSDPYLEDGHQWLNPAAFQAPAPGEFGNTPIQRLPSRPAPPQLVRTSRIAQTELAARNRCG
jgi:hypothetical protein